MNMHENGYLSSDTSYDCVFHTFIIIGIKCFNCKYCDTIKLNIGSNLLLESVSRFKKSWSQVMVYVSE